MEKTNPKVSLIEIFFGFARAGLFSFGGAMPWVKKLVTTEKKWIDDEAFAAIVGLCQFVPGPNATNVSLCVGSKLRGPMGSFAAATGLLLGPVVLACTAAYFFSIYGDLPIVKQIAKGMAAAGAGLLLMTGFNLAAKVRDKHVWLPLSGVVTFAVVLGFPALPVLTLLLLVSLAMTFKRWKGAKA